MKPGGRRAHETVQLVVGFQEVDALFVITG